MKQKLNKLISVDIQCIVHFILLSMVISIGITQSSCKSDESISQELLIENAKAIILDNQAYDSKHIEKAISSIKEFLIEFPDTQKYSEFLNYINELQRCLDFHKVIEYTDVYKQLIAKSFTDILPAIQEQEKYLNEFTSVYGMELIQRQPQLNTYIEDINRLREEFVGMKILFESEYADLMSYNNMVRNTSYKFENSRFESVRKSWKNIVDNQRSIQAVKDLDNKVRNFNNYLKEDAERICLYNYTGFVIDHNFNTQEISIGSPFLHDTYNGKICEGVFRVSLKGAYLGLDKGTVKILVKGMIVVTVDNNNVKSGVEYENVDFTVLEITGDL